MPTLFIHEHALNHDIRAGINDLASGESLPTSRRFRRVRHGGANIRRDGRHLRLGRRAASRRRQDRRDAGERRFERARGHGGALHVGLDGREIVAAHQPQGQRGREKKMFHTLHFVVDVFVSAC